MFARDDLRRFANLFIGRRDDYAVQHEDGRYLRAGRPLTFLTLERHLLGAETIGTYVLDEQGLCRFAVFDDDTASPHVEQKVSRLVGVQQRLRAEGVPSLLEGSRRGCHLWVLCDTLVPASHLRRWLLPFCPTGVEFYPKQDEGSRPYGSLMRVPLGVHRRSHCRYWFFSWHDDRQLRLYPLAQNVPESLTRLAGVERAVVPALETLPPLHERGEQTNALSLAKKAAGVSVPATLTIRDWCASQNAVEVMSRYVQLDRRGMACCPFGEHHEGGKDAHPSLHVYTPTRAGGSCWYCYVWNKGGTLFDFLCLWHNLDAKTLWRRILKGEVV
jgi:hypothetical protein